MKIKITETRLVDNLVFFPGEVIVKKDDVAKKLKALEAGQVEEVTEEVEEVEVEEETEAEAKAKSKSRK